jgi:Zn-dependent protease
MSMRSWKIGTAFGIGIYLHWTFLLLVGFILWQNLDHGLDLALYAVTVSLFAFGCVVLHELGHALMARKFGIATRDITLYPIGGVARLERMSERPWEELCIAVAGPAVNVGIVALLMVPALLSLRHLPPVTESFSVLFQRRIVFDLTLVNVILVVLNMLPAFPMDGGRVLRALLSPSLGRLRATEVAASVGKVFAVLFTIGGLYLHSPLALIGLFVFLAGHLELAALRHQEYLRRQEPLDVVPAEGEILDAVPVRQYIPFTGSVWDPVARAWIVWRNGRPIHTYYAD